LSLKKTHFYLILVISLPIRSGRKYAFSACAEHRKLRFGFFLRESETNGLGDWNLLGEN